MMRPIRLVPIALVALVMARSGAAAQVPDEPALARAAAAAMLRQYGLRLFLLAPPPGRFDTLMAVAMLEQAPGRQDPESDYALYIGTEGAQLVGDTAAVTVAIRQQTRGTEINFWEQTETFYFVRDGDAWRFVRKALVSRIHCGSVRGALDPPGPPGRRSSA